MRGSFRSLSASVGAPEPHDFAVRTNAARRAHELRPAMCVHRIPLPTSVTIASRPSLQVRDGVRKPLIWGHRKAEYFFVQNWTTQIALNPLTKSASTRTPFSAVQAVRTAQYPRKSIRSAPVGQITRMDRREKNSPRVYVFRFVLKLGHCSTRSARRICARSGLGSRPRSPKAF
jgi:hypothetical protein